MPKTIIICHDDEQSRATLEKLKANGTITDDMIVFSSVDEFMDYEKKRKIAVIGAYPSVAAKIAMSNIDAMMQPPEKTFMDLVENIQKDAVKSMLNPPEPYIDFPRHTHHRPKYLTKKSKFNKRRK